MNFFQIISDFFARLFSRSPSPAPGPGRVILPPSAPNPEITPAPVPSLIPPVPAPPLVPFLSDAQLKQILPALLEAKRNEFLSCLLQTFVEFGITTPVRIAAFIAQTAHESASYRAFAENLNYSAEALTRVWPVRFPSSIAASYAMQPEKIANRAYGGRLGNGDEASGDGWRYRGRGVIQITGRTNYQACGASLGLDLIASPELLEQPLNAFRSAGWYWKSRDCSAFADAGDFVGLTKKINGGLNGLDDRNTYHARAKTALGI